MKVLILTDDRYAEVLNALEGTGSRELVGSANAAGKLPKAEELHALARNGGEPQAFKLTRERQQALGFASERVRDQLHGLILAAHKLGVRPSTLARWSGYSPRRIHQITSD